ncbi:FecR domain-containing protein [Neptuniibacter sp. 1_MG-2023]|uniref:FecR domain-containing protein n=1 Tax=Neptuniibacter sp. 1_MG-2023 TaxID=3062662 RepID=UPI0026E437AE|nr:FecR domain-containing protein [Neptuniibacter sp. 1_MG-2023]MDO6593069.1 FecR domain-containing protein [Neptuniibacter sp. 1_MG-2023]
MDTTILNFYKKSASVVLLALLFNTPSAIAQEWIYSVVQGDTLSEFSEKHLYKTSYWKQLQKINNIADPKRIPENTKLRIPIDWIKSQPASAQVIKFEGDVVTQSKEGTDSQQVSVGQQLNLGDHLETYSQSSALIRFADGSEILVLQNSKIDFNHMTKYGETGMVDSRVRLISGDIESHAATQKGSASRFEIHTPAAISAVRGTRFRTSYTAADTSSTIEVLEGGVAVKGAKTTRLVRAGYGTHVVKNKAPLKPKKLLPAPQLLAYPQPIETIGSQIRWEAIEGAQRYRFIIAESNEFSTVLWDSDSERNAISLPDLSDDTYFLQLRAVDKYGIEGIERVQTFTLNAHPQPPFPMAPNNKATIRGEAPVLEWTQSSEAVSYRLQIASDQQFSNILLDRPSLTSNQFTASELLPTNTYYWRVASLAGDGELGPYGTQRSLTVKPIPATPEPALVQNEREIKLSWTLGLPDESYQIQISKDPSFKSIITDTRLTKPEITLERPEGYRYVRVRSLAEDGFAGAWGVTQELTPPPNENWIYVFGSFVATILLL